MRGFTSLLAVVCLLSFGGLSRAAEDPVKVKLDAAQAVYDKKMGAFKTAAGEWFDRQEKIARRDGDKDAIDQIKAARLLLEQKNELPKNAPQNLVRMQMAPRPAMELAYKLAIKEYTKANKDAEAATVQKLLTDFEGGVPAADEEFHFEGTWRTTHESGFTATFKVHGEDVYYGREKCTWKRDGSDIVLTWAKGGWERATINKDTPDEMKGINFNHMKVTWVRLKPAGPAAPGAAN